VKKILLMGNPNVGKSAIFSRLTGARVMISNYPGTTIEYLQGNLKIGKERLPIVDVPGTYALEPTNKAEEVAREMLDHSFDHPADKHNVVVNVVDATNLERNLYLTLELLEKRVPCVVALNIWDETKHKGIEIDVEKLQEFLGVPVVTTCGLTGEGVKDLVEKIKKARPHKPKELLSSKRRWQEIGNIIDAVQKLHHRHHTFLERLEDASIHAVTAIPLAGWVIFTSFMMIRFVAESLIAYVLDPLFEQVWAPVILKISAVLGGSGILHDILVGNLIAGEINFGESFGVLTTGLYVPLAMVLPYILSFYLVLGILEDFGYLPRLAVLADNLMHRIGLHGYAIIPTILGLGCNVPGALATRLLEGKREKFIAATLMAIAVPCMAQIAMIVGLVGARGGEYVLLVFGILFIIFILKGLLLNRFLKGSSPEILVEMPPYRIPQAQAVAKKLFIRVRGFLFEAVPYVLLGVFAVNLLYMLGIIEFLAKIFSIVLVNVWGLPREAISALLIGFLRKDIAVGMLGPLNLTTKQLVTGSVILTIYFPCIATFTVLSRELGIKNMAKAASLMLITALLVGGILNLIL